MRPGRDATGRERPAPGRVGPAGRVGRLGAGWAAWGLLAVVAGLGLWIGVGRSGPPPTTDQQVRAIAAEVRCPSCADLNAAQSDDVTAVAVRDTIRQRLLQGQSRSQIEAFLVSRYGPDILLRPPTHGAGALVWALPLVAAGVLAGAGVWALHRWRGSGRPPARTPDEADLSIVERALESEG